MKYNLNNLYFAKCRHCIEDIIMSYYEDDKEILPRPDYVDYYTILLLKNGKYINIYDKYIRYENEFQITNKIEHYDEDLVLDLKPLKNFINIDKNKIKHNELLLVDRTIEKTLKLKPKYGYKNR